MEDALMDVILGNAPLQALVDGRVHWGTSPQGTPAPRIVLVLVDGIRTYTMGGPANYVQSRVQAECYGQSYSQAAGVRAALIAALSGYKDSYFSGVFVDGETGYYDADPSQKLHRITVDFMVHHKEI